MGNELISREALRKVFSDWHNWYTVVGYGEVVFVDKLLEEIDNAPTVNTSKIEHKAYNEGFKDGVEQGIKLSEGRKGEWIDYSEDYGYAECPFCHKATTCEDNIDELHFCWNCGAKLVKGGAE